MTANDHQALGSGNLGGGAMTEAHKADSGKLRPELLPFAALESVSAVFTFGARKYDRWRKSEPTAEAPR